MSHRLSHSAIGKFISSFPSRNSKITNLLLEIGRIKRGCDWLQRWPPTSLPVPEHAHCPFRQEGVCSLHLKTGLDFDLFWSMTITWKWHCASSRQLPLLPSWSPGLQGEEVKLFCWRERPHGGALVSLPTGRTKVADMSGAILDPLDLNEPSWHCMDQRQVISTKPCFSWKSTDVSF